MKETKENNKRKADFSTVFLCLDKDTFMMAGHTYYGSFVQIDIEDTPKTFTFAELSDMKALRPNSEILMVALSEFKKLSPREKYNYR